MASRQPILLSAAGLGLMLFAALVVFGDKGVVDLHYLRGELQRLESANRALIIENHSLYQEKVRLEHKDPALIEHVARKDLGFVAPGDWVLISPARPAKLPRRVDSPVTPDPQP
ncbi:MAG: FtsB family cell division protein [Desulfobacterales bacterium]